MEASVCLVFNNYFIEARLVYGDDTVVEFLNLVSVYIYAGYLNTKFSITSPSIFF